MALYAAPRTIIGAWSWGPSRTWDFGRDYGVVDLEAFVMRLAREDVFIDTAAGYGRGHSNDLIRIAIERYSAPWRVISKVQPWHATSGRLLQRAVNRVLANTACGTVDELVLHNPAPRRLLTGIASNFRRLKEEGVVRSVGLSNFSASLLPEALAIFTDAGLAVRSLHRSASLVAQAVFVDGTAEFCRNNSIELVTHGVLGQGLLSGRVEELPAAARKRRHISDELVFQTRYLRRLLEDLGVAHRCSAGAVSLAWARAKGCTPIYGVHSWEQLSGSPLWNPLTLRSEELAALDIATAPWREIKQ